VTQRLATLPKDPEARANAIHEAAVWFAENGSGAREAKIAELEAPRTTRH
jgi:hypothetical protein